MAETNFDYSKNDDCERDSFDDSLLFFFLLLVVLFCSCDNWC
ncbi:hypothetical protein [Anaerosalibacter massiliensis]|uniref:YjcZ family sporulation protein n=1 Tax=Anaerosalibacter massiliensis TaxID=1347392 RepID=A0A9X2MK31_9FIRM|nr:hypothetical protein [Anaerosalibacter massiliensis]MCR2044978.1 hypothetical protein [Anaerosalibacter massiliensis]